MAELLDSEGNPIRCGRYINTGCVACLLHVVEAGGEFWSFWPTDFKGMQLTKEGAAKLLRITSDDIPLVKINP